MILIGNWRGQYFKSIDNAHSVFVCAIVHQGGDKERLGAALAIKLINQSREIAHALAIFNSK